MKKSTQFFLLCILLFGLHLSVKAEPIRITAGSSGIVFSGLSSTNTPRFSISGTSSNSFLRFGYTSRINSNNISPIRACLVNCQAGDIYSGNLFIFIGGSEAFPLLNGIPASLTSTNTVANIDGENFSNFNFSGTTFNFRSVTDVIPNSELRALTLELPFFMSGKIVLNGTTSRDITGLGLVKIFYFRNDSGKYDLEAVTYNFQSGPEPTPEPTTLLLLATGLAGIGGYASRRRKKKQQN